MVVVIPSAMYSVGAGFNGMEHTAIPGRGTMNCEELKSSVLRWLGSEIECRPSDSGSFIATFPVLRLNGDAIEIGISPAGDGRWRLSDLGETHSMFFLADLDFHDDYVRAEEFNQIVVAHHLTDDEEITTDVDSGELTDKIFDFLHALQSMSGLQFTAKPRKVQRDFNTIVAMFFAQQRASITIPPEPIEGVSGQWKFDFSLNHVAQETLVKTISTVGKNVIKKLTETATFEIGDIKKLRSDAAAVVIGDDHGQDREILWRPDVLRIFKEYDVPFFAFEKDQDGLVELAQSILTR